MKRLKLNFRLPFLLLFALAISFSSCKKDDNGNPVINAFDAATDVEAVWVEDATLLAAANASQGSGNYPGVDTWATATIPAGTKLYGGIPGQSEFYATKEAMIAADTVQVAYWESLQVQAHPTFGYRTQVAIFNLEAASNVAISKVEANPQFGAGGAWQIFLEDFGTKLVAVDTITLKQ